jgi:cell division protein FtsQ
MQSVIRRPRHIRPAAPYTRRDPAPSRLQYRWQRLWLTPFWRFAIRVLLPFALLAGIAALVWSDPLRAGAIKAHVSAMQEAVQNRQEFLTTTLSIEAQVQIRSGGVLRVQITERIPVLVWRKGEHLILVDSEGHPVAGLHARSDRADLPLIAGQGANEAAGEALDILATAGPIAGRIQGLVRMGQRRWDIVLDYGQRLMLPAENPIAALDRALALDQAERLFDRDILAIDLRYGPRPVLRLAPYALTKRQESLGLIKPVESSL